MTPFTIDESQQIERTVYKKYVLSSRIAYRDKHVTIRTPSNLVPVRHEASMAIPGHRVVDIEHGLHPDAPTVTRLSTYLVLLCATLNMPPCSADVKAMFWQSARSERLANRIYLWQPCEGFPALEIGQLIAVLKLLFGFADSPHAYA